MKKYISFCVSFIVVALNAANYEIDDLTSIANSFYREGDTLTLPSGSYTVIGDAVATVSDNVVTCKKGGFTLINDASSDYRLCVVPQPPAGGDVFYWFNNNNSGENWTSVAWTNLTKNTDRSYPNNANDIAVVEGGCCWAKMLVNTDISIHAYIVGDPKIGSSDDWTQLEGRNSSTLTFCGTGKDPAYLRLTSMYTGKSNMRIGEEKGSGSDVLSINVSSPKMIFDFCGDSAGVAAPYRGESIMQMNAVILTVPEESTVEFANDSKKVTDYVKINGNPAGYFTGTGTLVFGNRGGVSLSLLNAADHAFAGTIKVHSADWKGMVEVPAASLSVIGAPNAGRKTLSVGFDNCSANPGRSQVDARAVELDGGCLKVYRNYADGSTLSAWYSDTTDPDEIFRRLTVTNDLGTVAIKGDCGLFCECSYAEQRVRQYIYFDEILRPDCTGTMMLYDMNFRDRTQRTSAYYDRVLGEGLVPWAVGKDSEEGNQFVYKIIPWMACTCNDNGYSIYSSWGSEMTFPAVVDGALYSKGRTNRDLNNVVSEWENVYFSQKGIGISSNITINSFTYNTAETTPYPNNLVLGNGKKLTIKSGGMIFARSGRWFGATQTSYFPNCGTVEFGGEHAYLLSDFGVPNGDTGWEWNVMWASMIATNGLVKGGCGELVLAADQTGVDRAIWVNGGMLWLGHPANYRQSGWLYSNQSDTVPVRGCATDVPEFYIRAGAVLGIPLPGYNDAPAISRAAVINLDDNAAGTAKIEIAAGADQICKRLYINGKSIARGTYGATGSGAANIDDLHFVGTGKLSVSGDDTAGLVILIR